MRKLLSVITGFYLCFFFNAACQAATSNAAEEKITEQKILAILKSMDAETIRGNVKGITAYMAGDVIVRVDIPGPEGRQILTMTRDQYEHYVEEGISATTEYDYARKDTQIEISPEGDVARVTSLVLERAVMNGSVIKTTAKETSIFEVRQGRIVITSIDAVILGFDIDEERARDL